MQFRVKSWVWKFTYPFAHKNFTQIGRTLYYPKDSYPKANVIEHEKVHEAQQMKLGVAPWFFLYLFCFPFLWNPWRYKWEMEAYSVEGIPEFAIKKELRSYRYGWLRNG
jgi:hypothetical protein